MKIALFDEINETHVCDALAAGLERLGHRVHRSGPVWRGHAFAVEPQEQARIDAAVDAALAFAPDAWLNFRASSLCAEQVERIRRAGVRTAVWLPDDPVLYGRCYAQVVDAYDTVLHCAGRRVLDFYRYRGHRIGVNFPFWLDPAVWPMRYEPDACDAGPVFFGNLHGPAKKDRYETFLAIADDVAFYGRLNEDPRGRWLGQLQGPAEAVAALPRHCIGLNAPQRFADYAGTAYDFAGLALLGCFFLPSRVLQYASLGLPTLTLHPGSVAETAHYPPGLHARDVAQAREVVARVRASADYLRSLSRAARLDVERHHDAGARAAAGRAVRGVHRAGAADTPRAGIRLPLRLGLPDRMNPDLDALRLEIAARVIDQGVHWRILFVGRSVNGATDIASCLVRSLRNLGHHVLDVDLAKAPEVVEPGGRLSGHGPVHLRLPALMPYVLGFEPQIIVCAAGGLAFRPTDAEALKSRGIVLVGLTLGDPDMFDSVHARAGVFDFHATNARAALDLYRTKGVNNTVWFPFGVDRGSVMQSVPAAPEFDAELICMGDAVDLPERHRLMNALAGRFRVRTYGRGWTLPGSATLEGERRLQAMRMGRAHVSFPLARAGSVDVDRGAFESVGAGALLCTGRFDELASFFRYDDEILGFDDADGLARQLREVLDSPERYRRMTGRAFRRLIDEHLYEHRWMALFERMFNVSPDSAPWLGEERVAAIRRTLARSLPRARKVIVSGFYGARNLGDELILSSIRQALERADPAVQVWVAAEHPSRVERDHGLQAFSRRSHHEALFQARTAAAVVVGGGGLWHDYSFERAGGLVGLFEGAPISIAGFSILPLLGRVLGVPFHIAGLGVGPLADPDARALCRFVAAQAQTLQVRDAASAAWLREAGVPEAAVRVAPDVVYALALPEAEVPPDVQALKDAGHRIVALNLRPWAASEEDRRFAALAEALRAAARGHRLAFVGVPMQAGDAVDVAALGRFAEVLGDDVPWVALRDGLTPARLLGALSAAELVVTMRLHAALLAHRLRKPVLGIAYDPKVAAHFAEIGRDAMCLPLLAAQRDWDGALAGALAEGGRLAAAAAARVGQCEDAARRALAEAAQAVVRDSPRPVVYALPPLPRDDAAAGRTPAVSMRARFADVVGHGQGLGAEDEAIAFEATDEHLQLHLPLHRPRQGQELVLAGAIEVAAAHPCELACVVTSAYRNPRAVGRMEFGVRIGEDEFVEDIAVSADPVHLRVILAAGARLPVALRVGVLRDCFESSAWPKASLVRLQLLGCRPLPTGGVSGVTTFASRAGLRRAAPAIKRPPGPAAT